MGDGDGSGSAAGQKMTGEEKTGQGTETEFLKHQVGNYLIQVVQQVRRDSVTGLGKLDHGGRRSEGRAECGGGG